MSQNQPVAAADAAEETPRLNRLREAYDPEGFRADGHALIDMLADYLTQAESRTLGDVLPPYTPDQMAGEWTRTLTEEGLGHGAFMTLIRDVVDRSIHVHHPKYIGHQVSAPLPAAALCDLVSAMLNNGAAVYEMGQVETILERELIEWMGRQLGFGDKAGGVFTSGGSMGNLTALLAARQLKAGVDVWNEGYGGEQSLAVLVSDQAHYCVKRAVQLMGMGADGAVLIPTDASFRSTREGMEEALKQAQANGRKVFAIVGSACSTSTGSFDPLEEMADFANAHDLWFHVDGAHGASIILSETYRHLLNGVEHADSVVWDAHKMMMMPALTTAVIYRDQTRSYAPFSQVAGYLYEGKAEEEWFNLGHRTLECTKVMMALKLYVSLMVQGRKFFADYIDRCIENTHWLADVLRAAPDFELAVEPQCNIICFRHVPTGSVTSQLGEPGREHPLNQLQAKIRQEMLRSGKFYIVQTWLNDTLYLRCTIINPLTTQQDLFEMLEEIRNISVA